MAAPPSTTSSASMQTSTVTGLSATATTSETRDDDDISLASTVESEPQDEYEVETIYAEENIHGIKTYLVKWKGYSDLRCTWEPVSSFNGVECLKDWRKKKQAIKRGLEQPFDLLGWEARLDAFLNARDERKRRRREKRASLGLVSSRDEATEQEHAPSETDGQTVHQLSESEKVSTGETDTFRAQSSAQMDTAPPPQSTTSPEVCHPTIGTNATSPTAVSRVERPRVPAPGPVPITVTNDRTNNPSHRAKGKLKHSADHEPIREELELQNPGEWTPFQISSYLRKKSNVTNDTIDTNDRLFVEQEDNHISLDSHSMTLQNSLPESDNAAPEKQLQEPLVESSLKKPFRFLSKPPTGPRSHMGPKRPFRVRSHEFGKKSDLRCQLSYGPNGVEVGGILLCGISDSARRTINATKRNHVIHIAFDDLCSLNDYRAITRETGDNIQFNGCITTFSDTQAELIKFGGHLLANGLVAISRIPNLFYPQYSLTLICYPAQSKDFQFLNRYSYVAPQGSLSIAGIVGLLPRLSQVIQSRNSAETSERINSNRLERPERQGRSHEKDGPTSPERASHPELSVAPADTKTFSTTSTPNPIEVRKVSKTPAPSSKQSSGNGAETASKPVSVTNDDKKPGLPRKVQLNNTTATGSHLDGDALSANFGSMDISRLTTSVDKSGFVDPFFNSANQDLPLAESYLCAGETQEITPAPPDQAVTVKQVPGPIPDQGLSADTEAMDITSSLVSSERAVQSTSEAPLGEQQKDGTRGSTDVDMLDVNTEGQVDVKEYVKKAFPRMFSLDFSNLATITSHGRSKITNCFYLCFPDEADADLQILEHYLNSHLAIILSSRKANDWQKFTRLQSGVALFHHSYMQYYALPGLQRLTRSTSFNFWNVSLSAKIPGLGHDAHFQRIFPNGAGFLMTEDFMLHEQDATIVILGWFREHVRSKVPGSYRMMFRPNIMNWLYTMSERDPRFTVMAVLVGDIASRGNPSNWPVEPRDLDQLADPLLETPAVSLQSMPNHSSSGNYSNEDSIRQRNGDYLCEIFSAWALLNIASMRRFCILTHDDPREPWRNWTHIEISRDPADFYQKWGINKELYSKWLAQDTSQTKDTKPLVQSR